MVSPRLRMAPWIGRGGRTARYVLGLALLAGGRAGARPGPGPAECQAHSYGAEIDAAVRDVFRIWPVPPPLIRAVILRESDFNPGAISSAGAVGLMQVLPSNAGRLGVTVEALRTPAGNILAGTRLLAVLLRHYRGDVLSALVGYNALPRRPFSPMPDNLETPGYVRAVMRSWWLFERCTESPASTRRRKAPRTRPQQRTASR